MFNTHESAHACAHVAYPASSLGICYHVLHQDCANASANAAHAFAVLDTEHILSTTSATSLTSLKVTSVMNKHLASTLVRLCRGGGAGECDWSTVE